MSAVAAADRWLFLTPEVEAHLPDAAAALAAALGEDIGGAAGERSRVEQLVVRGRYPDWLAYLRERRALLERYVARAGADPLAGHVAALLNEQYMLALTVPGAGPETERERERVGELLRAARGPSAR